MAERNPARERTRLTVLGSLLAALVVAYAVFHLGGDDVVYGPGVESLDYTARNLPLLELAGIGSGANEDSEAAGNPFAFRPPPTPTPNLTPQPTPVPRPTLPPRPTPTPRIAIGIDGKPKPPPPPFNREYIGHLGPKPLLVAAFRKGSGDQAEVEVAAIGDVLDDIFIVRSVGYESVTIGFVGYDASEDTSVPLSDK